MTPFFAVIRANHSPKKNSALAPLATFVFVMAMAAFFLYHPPQSSFEPKVAQQTFEGTNRHLDFPNRSTFPSQFEEPEAAAVLTHSDSNVSAVLASDLK